MIRSTQALPRLSSVFSSQSNLVTPFSTVAQPNAGRNMHSKRRLKKELSLNFQKMSYSRSNLLVSPMLSKLEMPTPILPLYDYEISLHILSNYGDPNHVSLSEIDILESKGAPVKDVTIFMENGQRNKRLELLHDNTILKSSREKMWVEEWNLDKSPLILRIRFKSPNEPESIRIFNSRVGGNSNVKDFEIYDECRLFRGTMPNDFGVLAPLINCHVKTSLLQECVHFENKKERMHDNFGDLPIPQVKTIEITLVSALNHDRYIGLNNIELFNEKGEAIPYKCVASIEIINGTSITDDSLLLKLHKRSMNDEEMWIGKKMGFLPISIRLKLDKPRMISLIRIWNYNGCKQAHDFSVSHVSITINSKHKIWSGRLRPGKGTLSLVESSVTDIWMIDSHTFNGDEIVNFLRTSREE